MRDPGLPSASSTADDGTGLGTVTRALTAILALLVASARGLCLIACRVVGAARVVVGPLSHGALVLGRGAARSMRSLLLPIRAVGEPFVVVALRALGALGRLGALWVRRTIAGLRRPLGAWRVVTIAVLHKLVPVGRAVRGMVAAARRMLRVVFTALRAVLGPGIAPTRRAFAFVARLVGRVGAARGWVQRPIGRIGVAVVLAILLLISSRAARRNAR